MRMRHHATLPANFLPTSASIRRLPQTLSWDGSHMGVVTAPIKAARGERRNVKITEVIRACLHVSLRPHFSPLNYPTTLPPPAPPTTSHPMMTPPPPHLLTSPGEFIRPTTRHPTPTP